ncbi:MAG: GNAT family N-acetyltransferase [Pirellulaceae bacterium]|jgi:GNAT superfamily N-acetyltransferase|nr:GNAT family N-acetyltransferase [Pirellulaceae bacterium]MDP7015814.1 GNAT family N-acetyltransferase [Pirellulaceae bacterium]
MTSDIQIQTAEHDDDIMRCFPVIQELRPHVREDKFVSQVRAQSAQCGYALALAQLDGQVVGVAGFRITENLAWGRHVFVDDLVTAAAARSRGVGSALLHWLVRLGKSEGCGQLHLDSGVQRHDAHRFYLRERMDITSHHFALSLATVTNG